MTSQSVHYNIAASANAPSPWTASACGKAEEEAVPAVVDGFKDSSRETLCPPLDGMAKALYLNAPCWKNDDKAPAEQALSPDSVPEKCKTSKKAERSAARQQAPEEEVNFASLYGLEETSSPHSLQKFTKEDVERYYLANKAEEPTGLTSDGLKLYKMIQAKYIDRVEKCPYGHPSIYLTGGLPGSGKSTLAYQTISEQSGSKQPGYVKVDPDEIKKDIICDLLRKKPSLKEAMMADPLWATVVHRTSDVMARRLVYDAIKTKKDILFDSSMATSEVEKYRDIAHGARKSGYKVYGILTKVDVDVSVQRAMRRAQKPTIIEMGNPDKGTVEILALPGRLTVPSYVRSCERYYRRNLKTYVNEGLYDKCVIFDNNGLIPNPSTVYVRAQNSFDKETFTMKEVEFPASDDASLPIQAQAYMETRKFLDRSAEPAK